MPSNSTLLIVGPDPRLPREVEQALSGKDEARPVVHVVADLRQGIESLRSRRPTLALVEMTTDLRALQTFAEEAALTSPETIVVGAFAPHLFGPEVSESAVLISSLRAGVRDFLRRPISSADLGQLLDRLARPVASTPARLGTITSFISNKGGVGKSTLTVNVACGLAKRHPERVLLIDASLQLGVCASMLDLQPTTTLTDAVRERDRLDESLLRQLAAPHPCGLHLLAAPASAVEATDVSDEVMARILTLARRSYDFVLVDSFPLLDSVMLTVIDLCDLMYLVMESVVPTILGGAKLIQLLDDLGFPPERQRVVLNRYSNFAGNLKPADVAARIGRPVDHVIPYQKQLLLAANLGRPYLLSANRWFSRLAPRMWELVRTIESLKPVASFNRNLGRPSLNGSHLPK